MDPIPRCRLPDHEQNEITDVCLEIGCTDPIRTICQQCLAQNRHSKHSKKNYKEFKKQYTQLNGEDNSIQEMLDLIDQKIKDFQSLKEHLQNQQSKFGTLMFPYEENITNVNNFITQIVEQGSFKQKITIDLSKFIIALSEDIYKKFHTLTFKPKQKIFPKPKQAQQLNQMSLSKLQQKAQQAYQKSDNEYALYIIQIAEQCDIHNLTTLKIKYDIYRDQQKHPEAIGVCTNALRKDINDKVRAEWFENRAFCYRHNGQKENAEIDLIMAYQLDPSRTDCQEKLKYLYNPENFQDIETMLHKFLAFQQAFSNIQKEQNE